MLKFPGAHVDMFYANKGEMVMIRIATANQKGGVGKTTITHTLARGFHRAGYSVLMIDADTQGNLTESFAPDKEAVASWTSDLWEHREAVAASGQALAPHPIEEGLAIFGGDDRLAMLDRSNDIEVLSFLKEGLLPFENQFDFCLIDTPPSLGFLAISTYCSAEHLVIPANPDDFSKSATTRLIKKITHVKKQWNPNLQILGTVINRGKAGTRQLAETIQTLTETLGDVLYPTPIRDSVEVLKARRAGKLITEFAPGTAVAQAFEEFIACTLLRLGLPRHRSSVAA